MYNPASPSAFLASTAGCRQLVHEICGAFSSDTYRDQALKIWEDLGNQQPPPTEAWDVPVVSASYDQILSTVASASDKARLLAVACKEAGAWLYALPIPSAGLKLEDNMVCVGVGLGLGTPLCVPHSCSGCNATVDESGHHGLS